MRTKICGITNLEDALDAIKAGVNALGFVFYPPSPRYITPQDAKKIAEKLPPFVQLVGLFVNENPQTVNESCKTAKMDIAQIISEDQSEEYFDAISAKYVKVLRAQNKEDIQKYKNQYVLVDAFVPGFGGEGKRVALEWFEDIDCSSMILAGGLNESNLKELKGFKKVGTTINRSMSNCFNASFIMVS